MFRTSTNPKRKMAARAVTATVIVAMLLGSAVVALGDDATDKKKDKKKFVTLADLDKPQPTYKNIFEGLDLSKFVWPNPPSITRIRYINYWSGEKLDLSQQQQKQKKNSWMERVSGATVGGSNSVTKLRWQLLIPNGIAVDSKGKVYIADSKVRAIFVVNIEDGSYEMIKNGEQANFKWLTGLAMDDSDRLFAADSGLRRVLVFTPDRKVEATITQGLIAPSGVAVDNENRLLYVADPEQDQIFVFDADPPFKKIRTLGTGGQAHKLTTIGNFAKPVGVAVDKDSNLYVSDTWNNRIQVFDADGNFIRTFGKAGDGVGYFSRPKGLAIDADGHVWVTDGMQQRVQVFTPEGKLLIWMGGEGLLPGSFSGLENVAIDSKNRVFTTEQLPGRLQYFRYTTNDEARAELDKRNQGQKKNTQQPAVANNATTENKEQTPK
jgi:sugar lactone lactonase YvrE